jgi:hypothetical protein
MNNLAGFRDACKLALLGVTNVRVDLPNNGAILADGTEIITSFPIELNSQWQSWLVMEAEQVQSANLVFARRFSAGGITDL